MLQWQQNTKSAITKVDASTFEQVRGKDILDYVKANPIDMGGRCEIRLTDVANWKDNFGFNPFVFNLDQNRTKGPEIKGYLRRSTDQQDMPIIFVKTKYIGDFEALIKLYETGELQEMLQ
ncbi:uncharacterized protein BYT42DRAFT_546056 [Radiomyces spectabilis]|uniref:uncharacterized protein n=1 Tax=Radiomyces spectabilis TaxID=64574 RepID=UPI00221E6D67|nr:uncharacterized protein BYT42DRAFT_546056 [Radiomyces spectabilis]KAI8379750.1 hypothetical protein BYT42DRAFT_546056 [Radiomyces spectabilis]